MHIVWLHVFLCVCVCVRWQKCPLLLMQPNSSAVSKAAHPQRPRGPKTSDWEMDCAESLESNRINKSLTSFSLRSLNLFQAAAIIEFTPHHADKRASWQWEICQQLQTPNSQRYKNHWNLCLPFTRFMCAINYRSSMLAPPLRPACEQQVHAHCSYNTRVQGNRSQNQSAGAMDETYTGSSAILQLQLEISVGFAWLCSAVVASNPPLDMSHHQDFEGPVKGLAATPTQSPVSVSTARTFHRFHVLPPQQWACSRTPFGLMQSVLLNTGALQTSILVYPWLSLPGLKQ